MDDLEQVRLQLQQAMNANQQLATEAASLTASLGRMTSERDTVQAQLDESRGKVVALQTRLASQSRAIDQARQEAADKIAAKAKENTDAMKRLQEQQAAVAQELSHLRQLLSTSEAQRAEAIQLLEKYEPRIGFDKANAELAELERQEAELARKKSAAKKAVESFRSAPPPDPATVDRASPNA